MNLYWLSDAKAILVEEHHGYYLTHILRNKKVHIIPKGISPKVNVRARLSFERAYFEAAIQHFCYYTTGTRSFFLSLCKRFVVILMFVFRKGFALVWWHINHCRLFIVKSILYIKIVLFQTIQFNIRSQFKCRKEFYFK